MNLDVKTIGPKLKAITLKAKEYVAFSAVLIVLVTFGFLIVRINVIVNSEPDPLTVQEELTQQQQITIDPDDVKKIQELEARNIEVQSLFNEARDNPFQE